MKQKIITIFEEVKTSGASYLDNEAIKRIREKGYTIEQIVSTSVNTGDSEKPLILAITMLLNSVQDD